MRSAGEWDLVMAKVGGQGGQKGKALGRGRHRARKLAPGQLVTNAYRAQVDKAVAAAQSLQACLDFLKEGVDGIAMRRGLDIDLDPALLTASNQERDEVTVHQAMAQVSGLMGLMSLLVSEMCFCCLACA